MKLHVCVVVYTELHEYYRDESILHEYMHLPSPRIATQGGIQIFGKQNFNKFRNNDVYLKLEKNLNSFLFCSSNRSRINLDKHHEVQIECYPGANFNHFWTMVTYYKGKYQPENIVLNININSNDKNGTNAVNQLRNKISSIRIRFQRSSLYFMELNVSDRCVASQKTCLTQISLVAKPIRDIQIITSFPAGGTMSNLLDRNNCQ